MNDTANSNSVIAITGDSEWSPDWVIEDMMELLDEYDVPGTFFEELTERQLEVVQMAYYSGFFESPRESSGEDIAETLGISSSAFYQHSRAVQRKLFSALFDEQGLAQPTPERVQ